MRAKVAILGASGYTGQELFRLLQRHPQLRLKENFFMSSREGQQPEQSDLPVDPQIHPLDLDALGEIDGVFLCTPHGASAALAKKVLERGCKVVDLSADFRLEDPQLYAETYGLEHPCPELLEEAVYGLTEHDRDAVAAARLVANPGCYPTATLLPLLPLLEAGLLDDQAPIFVDAKSGVSGAGKKPSPRSIYGGVAENVLAYGVGTHRHSPEIKQVAGTERIVFVPHLMPMFRGMLATLYLTPSAGKKAEDLRACLISRYQQEPFMRVFDRGQPETNRVNYTNQCHIAVAAHGEQVIVTAAIDNLGKGASGAAIQNMNRMLGCDEAAGLR